MGSFQKGRIRVVATGKVTKDLRGSIQEFIVKMWQLVTVTVITSLVVSCTVDLEEQIYRELDMESPVVAASVVSGAKVRRLEELRLVFTEPVTGADRLSAYYVSGDGVGTLAIQQIRVEAADTIVLVFSGTPADGEIKFEIRGVTDKVGNVLSNPVITWQGDGLPKWRFVGRRMSRGLVNVTQTPIEKDQNYLYLAYSDENCQQNYGYFDATVIRVNLSDYQVEELGAPCLIGAIQANSNAQSMVLWQGIPIVAFRDTSNPDSNKISVKWYKNNTWDYLGAPRFTPNALSPDLKLVGDKLYLSFRDATSTPANRLRIYAMDLTSSTPTWQELQNTLLSNNNVFSKVATVNYGDRLYFAFRDGSGTIPVSIRYYDFQATNYSSILNVESFTALDSTVHMTDHPEFPVVAFSYRPFNTRIALRGYDGDGWSATDWPLLLPELDLGTTAAANNLQCRFRGQQPFCAYVEGTGFIYVRTYTTDGWQHVKSPGATDSAINGGNPGLLVTDSTIYLVIRDKEVGFTNTLSLLTYE